MAQFQFANSEATRKIVKRHHKRTALMFPRATTQITNHPVLSALTPSTPQTSHGLTLPHLLLVLLTETLLPIIPSIDGAHNTNFIIPSFLIDSVNWGVRL